MKTYAIEIPEEYREFMYEESMGYASEEELILEIQADQAVSEISLPSVGELSEEDEMIIRQGQEISAYFVRFKDFF